MKESFDVLFAQLKKENTLKLKELHEEAIKEKAHVKKLMKIYILIPVLITIIIEIIYMYKNSFPNIALYFVSAIWCVVAFIVIKSCNINSYLRYNRRVKNAIIYKLINNFFDDVDYIPNKGISEECYKKIQINNYSIYNSDDYIEAKINNKYNVQIANVVTETSRSDSDGGTERIITFLGVFAMIPLNKNINNSIFIGNYKLKPNSREKVELDSSEFEKIFSTYAKDPIEAVQLLTSDVMELLVSFSKLINCDFDISIIDDCIYIRVNNGITLEPTVNKKEMIDENQMKLYYNTFDFIHNLTMLVINSIDESYIVE